MFGFHAWNLLINLLIALIIFGTHKLPVSGGAVGKSIRESKKAVLDSQFHMGTRNREARTGTDE